MKIAKRALKNLEIYDSNLLSKILNNISIETKNNYDKETSAYENWKINSRNLDNKIPSENSNLKKILSDFFPNKQIVVQDKKDGSQINI